MSRDARQSTDCRARFIVKSLFGDILRGLTKSSILVISLYRPPDDHESFRGGISWKQKKPA